MFAAMVLLLSREVQITPVERGSIEKPLAFMFGSFFSLIVAAFLFAAMSGERQSGSQTKQYVEGSLAALVLSIGVVQTAVALAWLLSQRKQVGMPLELSRRIVDATIVIAAFFLTGVGLSPLSYIHPDWIGSVTLAVWLVAGTLVAASVPVGWWAQRLAVERPGETAGVSPVAMRSRRVTLHARELDQIVRYVNLAGVGIAVSLALAWNLISGADDKTLRWLYEFPGVLLLVVYGVLAFGWFAALESCFPKPNQKAS
jgi:hypothetical protein